MTEKMDIKEFLGGMSEDEEISFVYDLQQSEVLPSYQDDDDLMIKMRMQYPDCQDEVINWMLARVFGI